MKETLFLTSINRYCPSRLDSMNGQRIRSPFTNRSLTIRWPRNNTWINNSRDWHIDGVANKSSVWFFMSTNLRKIPVKISWHSDVWSTRHSDLSNVSLDILKTMDSKQFRVLIYHCFLMMKKHTASSAMAWKVLRGLCSIRNNHLSVVCWV